jgi:tRNA(Arg) A34 adenosine deaminase TadA
MGRFPELNVGLPAWVPEFLPDPQRVYPAAAERMRLVIELSRRNVRHGTGGPFGAAVFDLHTHRLVAPGVNVVVPAQWSGGHAEMLACAVAQRLRGTHDLGAEGLPPCELVSSTEPCAMCLGATAWSGVRALVCGAREADARAVGFDEGPKPADWIGALTSRGIRVERDVCRDEAGEVLREYAAAGGAIYNGRGGAD